MFATIELQKQAAADRYYHQLHPKPWAKSPEEAAWALMQRIMGLVGEHKVPPLRGNLSGNLGRSSVSARSGARVGSTAPGLATRTKRTQGE